MKNSCLVVPLTLSKRLSLISGGLARIEDILSWFPIRSTYSPTISAPTDLALGFVWFFVKLFSGSCHRTDENQFNSIL
jgi:hypothetical protein